jgi:hypothetical protein
MSPAQLRAANAAAKAKRHEDWKRAVRLFENASAIGRDYGVDITPKTTFQDFLSQVATRMDRAKHGEAFHHSVSGSARAVTS